MDETTRELEDPMNDTLDVLYGANEIAAFLGIKPSAVYHLIENHRLPAFKLGKVVCATRSGLLARIRALEAQGTKAA